MRIKNKKNVANYVNYKVGGFVKKERISAGNTIVLPLLTNMNQIINIKDFNLGFLEVVKEDSLKFEATKPDKKKTKNSSSKKKEDALDKVKKEVKNYTDNKDNK